MTTRDSELKHEKHWSFTHPELYRLYHRLWSKAVGMPSYSKDEWKSLGKLLERSLAERPLEPQAAARKRVVSALRKTAADVLRSAESLEFEVEP